MSRQMVKGNRTDMREKTARTDVRTEPDLKAAYAAFCEETIGTSVSERTRNLWRWDMEIYGTEGPPTPGAHDAKDERESAA